MKPLTPLQSIWLSVRTGHLRWAISDLRMLRSEGDVAAEQMRMMRLYRWPR